MRTNGTATDVQRWLTVRDFGPSVREKFSDWDAKTLLALSKSSIRRLVPGRGEAKRFKMAIDEVISVENTQRRKFRLNNMYFDF